MNKVVALIIIIAMTNYKELEVWILSMEKVSEIYNLIRNYPKDEKYSLIDQTKRAAISIPSNIAEGLGRNHKKDTILFLLISRGSAYEVDTLLSIAKRVNVIDQETYDRVYEKIKRNIQVINGFINYLEKKRNRQRQRSTSNENSNAKEKYSR
jgi:four helix bundle protein